MDPILFWNEATLEVHRRDFTGASPMPEVGGPTRTSRAFAMIHLAMHDVWSKSKASPGPTYLSGLPVFPANASREAAVAGAMRKVALSLYTRNPQVQYLNQQWQIYRQFLRTAGQTNVSIDNGKQFGENVGQAMINDRSKDGSTIGDHYIPSGAEPDHRADPYHPGQGYLGTNWGDVTPFGMAISAITPVKYPALTDPKYKAAYDEVKSKGAHFSTTRTPDETAQAIFWAYDGARDIGVPPRLYNQCVREISLDKKNGKAAFSIDQNARLFALINMAMANAAIFAWREKYLYRLWRPIIGIREAGPGYGPMRRGNAQLDPDPFWKPLGSPVSNVLGAISFTPPFPAYPSGHATFGAACFEMVRPFVPNGYTFTMVSDEMNGVTLDPDGSTRTLNRRTLTLDKAIQENLESRIWQGVHWRFDGDRGKVIGEEIARALTKAKPF